MTHPITTKSIAAISLTTLALVVTGWIRLAPLNYGLMYSGLRWNDVHDFPCTRGDRGFAIESAQANAKMAAMLGPIGLAMGVVQQAVFSDWPGTHSSDWPELHENVTGCPSTHSVNLSTGHQNRVSLTQARLVLLEGGFVLANVFRELVEDVQC